MGRHSLLGVFYLSGIWCRRRKSWSGLQRRMGEDLRHRVPWSCNSLRRPLFLDSGYGMGGQALHTLSLQSRPDSAQREALGRQSACIQPIFALGRGSGVLDYVSCDLYPSCEQDCFQTQSHYLGMGNRCWMLFCLCVLCGGVESYQTQV